MVLPHSEGDLYHKYRPRKFSEISGHKEVVKSLKKAITSDHPSQVYLLTGDSGTGKTSSARIIALSLNCDNKDAEGDPCLECRSCKTIISGSCVDLYEINAADHRGIDSVREISSKMSMMPMQLKNKVYILDEFHQMTKEAQTSLLKVLEEAPKNVFIILCTTNPEKILPTVKTRCQQFKFKNLTTTEIVSLLEEVCAYEAVDLSKKTLQLVADHSSGSPRKALVNLQQVLQLSSTKEDEITRLLETEEAGGEDFFKYFMLIISKTSTWSNIVEGYADFKDMGPTGLGMSIAGMFRSKLTSSRDWNSFMLYSAALEFFVVPFDDGKLGENQLMLALAKTHKLIKQAK